MKLNDIHLLNFRVYSDFKTDFEKTNVIVGDNATGKTSLLEAIYLLSTSKSFRTTETEKLISLSRPFAKIEGKIEEQQRRFTLQLVLKRNSSLKTKKELKINGKKRPIISMLGLFQSVLFTPETLLMISGPPFLRRRSLDILLSSISKKYAVTLLSFLKTIRQRNRVLLQIKQKKEKPTALLPWNESFLTLSASLQKTREGVLKKINEFLPPVLKIKYKKSPVGDLKKEIEKHYQKEIDMGFSLYGPQKDDFIFLWHNRPLADFGSRGEGREALILFKLAEWRLLKTVTGSSPVLLLDDLFSELDRDKRQKIEELLYQGQTILTTTSLSFLSPKIIKESKVIELKKHYAHQT
jgi:DNA replication and repair protein RecF